MLSKVISYFQLLHTNFRECTRERRFLEESMRGLLCFIVQEIALFDKRMKVQITVKSIHSTLLLQKRDLKHTSSTPCMQTTAIQLDKVIKR